MTWPTGDDDLARPSADTSGLMPAGWDEILDEDPEPHGPVPSRPRRKPLPVVIWWCMGVAALVVAFVLAVGLLREASSERSSGSSADGAPSLPASSASPELEPSTAPTPSETPPGASPSQSEGALAADVLATLAVKGRAAGTGYSREAFGEPWFDVDGNGCDTRNDILRRDLVNVEADPAGGYCIVDSGILDDPYSGQRIQFVRGWNTSIDVQIDHVVALSNAWQTGAQYWPAGKRLKFAGDPLELLAVDGYLNQQKQDGDAATWLPPNKGFRCEYVARQVAIKAKYGLWVTPAERDAISRILSRCPGQGLPTRAEVKVPPLGEHN